MGDDLEREEIPLAKRLFIGGSHHAERHEIPVDSRVYQMFPRPAVSLAASGAPDISQPAGAVETYIGRNIDGTLTDAFGREETRRQIVMVAEDLDPQQAHVGLLDALMREFVARGAPVESEQPKQTQSGLVIPQ